MNPVLLLGACAGAGTATAALRAVQDEAGQQAAGARLHRPLRARQHPADRLGPGDRLPAQVDGPFAAATICEGSCFGRQQFPNKASSTSRWRGPSSRHSAASGTPANDRAAQGGTLGSVRALLAERREPQSPADSAHRLRLRRAAARAARRPARPAGRHLLHAHARRRRGDGDPAATLARHLRRGP